MIEFFRKFRIVALKLLELTRFLSQNLSIYFYFIRRLGSVFKEGDFQCIVHLSKSLAYSIEQSYYKAECVTYFAFFVVKIVSSTFFLEILYKNVQTFEDKSLTIKQLIS